MNNEPVAWMREDGTLKFKEGLYFEVGQAFYTHPVKELTDEEIVLVWDKIMCSIVLDEDKTIIDFARAILRKAQE